MELDPFGGSGQKPHGLGGEIYFTNREPLYSGTAASVAAAAAAAGLSREQVAFLSPGSSQHSA